MIMNNQEKLAELDTIRRALDKVAKKYCVTPEERKTVKEISMRLFTEQIIPLAEKITADIVRDVKKLSEPANSDVQLIDLGLPSGTLWADRNLGANAPEDYGDYFRFGETSPYTEESPRYQYTKIKGSIAGTEYDAATVILGKNFCMPTERQLRELLDNCEWQWTEQNGISGMKVTGPNGNSIFLPAAGYRGSSSGATPSYVRSVGCYWSATPYSSDYGYGLGFYSSVWSRGNGRRAYGFSVRPVAERTSKI